MTGLGSAGQILIIKIYQIDVFEAKLGGLAATQIPDRLRDAAGDEPIVWQGDFLEPFEDLIEPPVLPESDFQRA